MAADLRPIVFILLACLMLECGLQVTRSDLLEVFVSKRSLLARALLANFILVPLYAVIAVRAFHLSEYVTIGILLMAIAPGVPFLAQAGGRKAGGSLRFALDLCFLMPALSIITAPFTARLTFPTDTQTKIPPESLVLTLVVAQLIPLLIGTMIAERAPNLAARLLRPLGVAVAVLLLLVLVLISPLMLKSFGTIYGTYGTLTALLISLLSLGTGWVLGGPERSYRVTLSLATLLRNPGLALTVAATDFPRTLVTPMVMSYFLAQLVVNVLFHVYLRTRHKPAAPAAASAWGG